MSFAYPYLLLLLLLLPPLWLLLRGSDVSPRRRFVPELYRKMVRPGGGLSRRSRRALLFAALALGVIALARPFIDRGEIEVRRESTDLVVAFDISRSMFADDVYPNRLALAKRKFADLLRAMKDTRIAVIGFSSRAFLVAPLTRDYESLRYLVDHMGLDYVSLRGTDMLAPLEVTQNLLAERPKKALLIFTDGGEGSDFSKEIAYAKRHGITVYIYGIGTRKGGIMRLENGDVVRDANGEVVITRFNPAIRTLAEATGGAYMPFSLRSGDISALADRIRRGLEATEAKEERLRDRKELFVYPLAAAILLFMAAMTSLPRRRTAERGGGR
ncbi:vWA domain-containing protein [Hydrogenimonas sp.]